MDPVERAIHFAEEDTTKRAAYLLAILRTLGWCSVTDPTSHKLNATLTKKYIRKHSKHLGKLFDEKFVDLAKADIITLIDTINPHLIYLWHVQIIGTVANASLQLLKPLSAQEIANKSDKSDKSS